MRLKTFSLLFLLCCFCFSCFSYASHSINKMPDNFVDIKTVIPQVELEIRYFGPHNFLGEKVDGYLAPKCILTKEAATALSEVQKELEQFSLTLKIYDCYRPQQAVNHFVRWAKDIMVFQTAGRRGNTFPQPGSLPLPGMVHDCNRAKAGIGYLFLKKSDKIPLTV